MSNVSYYSVVRSLMYAMVCSRPNFSYAANRVMGNHVKIGTRILIILHGSLVLIKVVFVIVEVLFSVISSLFVPMLSLGQYLFVYCSSFYYRSRVRHYY